MDIDLGTDSLHCAVLQSLVVLTLLLWIRAGFHFTHVGLILAEQNYTQRSGLINPQYKDGSKCHRVKESLQNYHTLFSGLKLSHLTLLAVSGCVKSCICPGRLNSWASPWFSCLNTVCTWRSLILACQIYWAQFCLQQCWYNITTCRRAPLLLLPIEEQTRVCANGKEGSPAGRKMSRWSLQFKSGWNKRKPLGGHYFSKPNFVQVKILASQGGGQNCPLLWV